MSDMFIVFIILAATIFLFVLDRLRLDVVALLSLLALMLTGQLTVAEALAGFADPVVIIIAGLFVVGAGLFYTGVADAMGAWLGRTAGANEARIMVLLMLLVALLSAFMSSTGAVAVLLPVAVSLARDARTSPAKLLMPLAYGALIGGMLTLIGTPPNLVVSEQLRSAGYGPFGFFAFTPVGLTVLLVGVVYMLIVGRRVLPERRRQRFAAGTASGVTLAELAADYHLYDGLYRLRIRRASDLVNRTLADSDIGARYGVSVIQRQAWPDDGAAPLPAEPVHGQTRFAAHDILTVKGMPEDVARLCREKDLGVRPTLEGQPRVAATELGMAEVLIRGRSSLVGKTLQEARFRSKYNVSILAVMRRNQALVDDLTTTQLQFGDTLLVQGTWEDIRHLTDEHDDFIVLDLPRDLAERTHTRRHALTAVAIVGAMLLIMTFQLLPTVTAVLVAAVAMVVTGCVRPDDVYTRINWESIVLIAAMLPMATALEKSGGVLFVADGLVNNLGGYGTAAIMAGLYVITTFFSQFISNTATTVLVAPIAVQAALTLGIAPHALLMVVAIAASTAFATPIASPVNTLVLGPGDYRFMDFVKVGVPLQVIVLAVSLMIIPWLFPG